MNILIVKLSSLGDVVHTMPAVQDIRRAFPQAQIDWVVEPAFAPLLRRCAGVRRVISCAIRRWRKTPFSSATRQEWRTFKAELQSQPYDWVIDLQGLSKSALVAWLATLTPGGRRVALAHRTEGSSYEAPTRWVADMALPVPTHVHAVYRSRLLCAQALGHSLPAAGPESYGLETLDLSGKFAINFNKPVIALVHGTSRADKQWPAAHWLALAQRLHAAGMQLGLPHGNAQEQALAESLAAQMQAAGLAASVWPRLPLDTLADALAACAGVIGVDSGPSHVAVALGLPHVQIYNFPTAWRTGPNNGQTLPGARQLSVQASPTAAPTGMPAAPTVEAVWQAWQAVSAAPVAALESQQLPGSASAS